MKRLLLTMLMGVSVLSFANAQTVILTEDFEGGIVPATWSQVTSATDGGWKVGINTALESQYFPIAAHTKMICTNDDACNCDKSNDLLKSPVLDLSTYTNVFLSFDCYYFAATYLGVSEEAKVVVSTDSGTTWTDALVIAGNAGWHVANVNLSAYAGNASVIVGFKYNDGGDWLYGWAMDNVSIYEPVAGVDLTVASTVTGKLDPTPTFVSFNKYLTTYPLNVSTTVSNIGTVPITSFDFSWTDGVNTVNQSFTGVTIDPLAEYTFESTTPYTTLSGLTTITSSVSNINSGAVEILTTNNSATFGVEGVTPNPDKKYFAEEATGTWCQWCPRGAVFMDYMRETYPAAFVGVAVHNADPMVVSAYDAGLGSLITGYPSAVSEGNNVIDPSELEADFIDKITNAPLATITGTATLNLVTNQITVDLTGTFNQNLNDDYRFMAVVVEDSVTGSGSTWSQVNTYSGGANGPMGGFELLGNPVPFGQMKYDFVARALMGGFSGQASSIPGTIVSGTPYSYQFTAQAGISWAVNRLSVAAVILSGSNRSAVNAITIPVTTVTGINDNPASAFAGSYVYPTATMDVINLALNLQETQQVKINVTDVLGKVVMSQNLGTMQAGNQTMYWNVSHLGAGMYYLNIESDGNRLTQKFIKE